MDDMKNAVYIEEIDRWACSEEAGITENSIDKSGSETKYFMEGIAVQAEIKNGNTRLYKLDPSIRECNEYQTKIKDGRAVGELNHPGKPDINPERVVLKILEYDRINESNDFRHKSEVLPYGLGVIVRGHMDHGIQMATSSRALGKLRKTRDMIIVEDYKLVTPADIVWNNSAPDAIPTYIKEDLVLQIYDNVNLMESFYSIQIEESVNKLYKAPKYAIKDVINNVYNEIMNLKF